MSSNNPYGAHWGEGADWGEGAPQPPMSAQAPRPGQQTSPYGYPQQSPGAFGQQPVDSPDTTSAYPLGPFAPDQQQTRSSGDDTAPGYYGAPRGHYGARMQPTPPPKRGGQNSRGRILIIIGASALAVILMAVIAVVVATREPSAQGGQGAGGQQTNPSQGGTQATRPSDAVAGYLQAIAAGDATAALSYAVDPAPTGPLLTNEVLAASLERAPLNEIDVPVVEDQNAKSVSATYMLDGSDVSESFDVVKVGDIWKISRAVKDLDISFIAAGSIPVKINGVEVTDDSVAVLPGSYAFTTGLRYVSYGSKNVVLVKSPYVEADTYQIQTELTKAGNKAVIAATEKSFNKCLQQHSLNPKNCPQKLDSKYSYTKSTITWQQTGPDPFRDPSVRLSGTQTRIQIPINLRLSGSCSYQGRSGNCSGNLSGTAVAVMKVTTKPLKVKWLSN